MTKYVKCEHEGCEALVPKYGEKDLQTYPKLQQIYGYPQILKCKEHRQ